jgi:hypothetical protein
MEMLMEIDLAIHLAILMDSNSHLEIMTEIN